MRADELDTGLTCCQLYAGEILFFLFKVADSILEPTLRLYIFFLAGEIYGEEGIKSVQTNAAVYLMVYKFAVNLPAIVLGLFCGAWSDKVGRKLPVMFCCFGTILACLFYMSSMMTSPWAGVWLVMAGALLRGSFGKSAVITMALHSYIADVTSLKQRTQGLGRLLGMNYLGYCVGSVVAGLLLENGLYKYSGSFCVAILLSTCCVFIAILCMAESLPVTDTIPLVPAATDSQYGSCSIDDETKRTKRLACLDMEQPFRLQHIRESLSVLFQPRPGSQRCRLVTLFLLMISVQLCKSGESDVTLLYVERSPFEWRDSEYNYLLATDYFSLGIVQILLLPLLTRFCSCSDVMLVFIGLLFKAGRLFLLALSFETWHVFVAVVIGAPLSFIISGLKSMISKSVDELDIGKTFSLLSCGELMANLLGAVLFNNIYAATSFTLFPGFTFVVDLAIHVVMMGVVCVLMGSNCFLQIQTHNK